MDNKRTYTILIADDEPDILDLLFEHFIREGYTVLKAINGEEALKLAERNPDLVLLDVAMPHIDGLTVCRRLRDVLSCPIIFLSARVEDADILAGFELGADDYILKPFSLKVLSARVAAHLMREMRIPQEASVRFFGSISIDFSKHDVRVNDRSVHLTKTEFEILSLFAKSPGRIFDRETIHRRIGGWENESSPTVVTELVRRIRQKLVQAGADEGVIQTVWGIGYRWRG